MGDYRGDRGSSYVVKVRRIGSSKTSVDGSVYGVTLPRSIFDQFSGCQVNAYVEDNNKIILEKVKGESDE